MQRARATFETIHLTALGIWLGSVVMAGASAATIFPTLKKLNPRLPDYEQYTGDHWLLAAGQAAAKIFFITDIVQFVCSVLCILTMLGMLFISRMPWRRPSSIVRILALAAAVCVLGFSLIYLAPQMQINIHGYWDAARAGNSDEAAKFQQIFSADHPLASRLMQATAISVALCLVSGAWNACTSGISPPPARAK